MRALSRLRSFGHPGAAALRTAPSAERGGDAPSADRPALEPPGREARDPVGLLERPSDGVECHVGGVLDFAGWVLFDGQPADRLVAFIGDEPALELRGAQPRPDVAAEPTLASPSAIAAGFTGLVPVPQRWLDAPPEIRVRATMADGRTWDSSVAVPRVLPRWEHPYPLEAGPGANAAVGRAGDGGPLRLCVFTHSLNLGGGELYLQELLLRMRRDHDMQILVITPVDGPLKQELRDAGIDVHITHYYPTHPTYYVNRVEELALLVRAWRADAVLGNTLGVFPGIDAALSCRLPVVWAIHESFDLDVFAFLNWGSQALHPQVEARWRQCLAEAHTVFEAQSTLAMFTSAVPGMRARRVHYGIDLSAIESYRVEHDRDQLREELGIAPRATVLLCMGVIQERKAQLALVAAFAKVAGLYPDAQLVLVGEHPTPYAAAVREAVESLGLQDRVRVIGIQPDTYRWYHAADILVSASDTESLPRSMLEAMAFGLPVLAVDVFGVSEVIDDARNGWLCQPCDIAALTVGLYRALSTTPPERERMAQACRSDAAAFDGSHYAAEYAALIRGLVDSARRQAAPPYSKET